MLSFCFSSVYSDVLSAFSGLELLENYRVCSSRFIVLATIINFCLADLESDWLQESPQEVREVHEGMTAYHGDVRYLIKRYVDSSTASLLHGEDRAKRVLLWGNCSIHAQGHGGALRCPLQYVSNSQLTKYVS